MSVRLLTLIQSVRSLTFLFLSVSSNTTGTPVSSSFFFFIFKCDLHRFSKFQLGSHELSENVKLIRLSAEWWCTVQWRKTKSFISLQRQGVLTSTSSKLLGMKSRREREHASVEQEKKEENLDRKCWQHDLFDLTIPLMIDDELTIASSLNSLCLEGRNEMTWL